MSHVNLKQLDVILMCSVVEPYLLGTRPVLGVEKSVNHNDGL